MADFIFAKPKEYSLREIEHIKIYVSLLIVNLLAAIPVNDTFEALAFICAFNTEADLKDWVVVELISPTFIVLIQPR